MGFTFNPFTGNFDKVDERPKGSFAAANNQTVAANVTNLDVSQFKGGKIDIMVEIDATADLYEKHSLEFISKAGAYEVVSTDFGGDESNVDFTMTSGGQVQYTSGNEAGFVSSTFTWIIQEVK